MKKQARRRVAEKAALLMIEGIESEYLSAKERAINMLGFSDDFHMPSNRQIKDCIETLSKAQLGEEELKRRLLEMRRIAAEIMSCIEDCDPFLIGTTLSGQIRQSSDIDIHAYCDQPEIIKQGLEMLGYESLELETVINRKGDFSHLRWYENDYPVEITVYPWSWRHLTLYSSVTGKPMKRLDLDSLRRLLLKATQA